jgi:hypothetical protein
MTKFKELLLIIISIILNIHISFAITHYLNISNTIILKSYLFSISDISWEYLFFIILCLVEAYIYNFFTNK